MMAPDLPPTRTPSSLRRKPKRKETVVEEGIRRPGLSAGGHHQDWGGFMELEVLEEEDVAPLAEEGR